MSKPRGGGIKRSSWLTFRRRLLLVRILMRAPASSAELIAAINRELGSQGYPEAALAAMKHDFDALKGEYACQITYDRPHRRYILRDLGELALLDLSDESMEALAFLEASFPEGSGLPEHANLRDLLERIVLLLPPARQREHRQRRSAMRLGIGGSSSRIDPKVMSTVKRAIEQRRELEFDYLSTFDLSEPRRHRVAPYGITFRPEGHGYLDATVLEVFPRGGELIRSAIDYRLDRIVAGSAKILATVLPPLRPSPTSYQVRYTLVPQVARRRDVASYFPQTQITYMDDGSAEITAVVTNLWQARQVLLRYGDACQVHEPPELVALFRRTATGLARIYGVEESTDGEGKDTETRT
ncbi:helix-turn-helix transcriptional regulator [Candidatus Viridilinea mediisalina]|uniref:WYL domain-containing protein n=1 Tax=Candidatus Viridilinea mediisalina TaxID=2024553 RepID=A0A2A6RFV0_9CHLR|nr:WYL domain-containing protein [Candidatus Viridilinea mediisalina]PDW01755.1 WYL domain-containing protein [Candidatus Viridilinea mediisalina]